MRLLASSDWHLDAVTMGKPRRSELLEYLRRLVRAVRDERIDCVLVPGDFNDPGSMCGPQYEADIIHWLRELAEASRSRFLLAIAGNHDVVEVDRPLTTLAPAREAFRQPREDDVCVCVAEEPSVFKLGQYVFVALPFVSRAWADSEACGEQKSMGPAFCDDLAFKTATQLKKEYGCKVIVVGHRTVPGALIGSESAEMSRGRELDLPLDRIAELGPVLVVNGHYHRPQIVKAAGGVEVVIPGSPLSYSVDDPHAGKGYVVAEV